jgi:hypothetical protein
MQPEDERNILKETEALKHREMNVTHKQNRAIK